jgi:DNA-binding LytR/AlgR family response regulator
MLFRKFYAVPKKQWLVRDNRFRHIMWSLRCAMPHSVLYIKKGDKHIRVSIQDILYLNAAGSYLHVVTPTEKFSMTQNLSQFIRKNDIPALIRVHRSYLVNILHIDSFDQSFAYVGAHKIPISASYREKLMKSIRSI